MSSAGVEPIRLLLVDDHKVVRLGLVALFRTVPGVQVIGDVGTVAEAMAAVRDLKPTVVIMDVRLPDGDGISACRAMQTDYPDVRVVMLTSFKDEEAVLGSVRAGALAYVLKETDPTRVIEAVERAARGESLLDPAVTRSVMTWIRQNPEVTPAGPLDVLSPHEREIVFLIAEGLTNRQMAERMVLSEFTVKSYVSGVLHKLSFSRRSEVAAFAARLRADEKHLGYVG